jgi:hypothetical protein
MKFEESHVGLKLNGTHQLLPYADDMNLLGGEVDIITKNTGMIIEAGRDASLKIGFIYF